MDERGSTPMVCHRCGLELTPGEGNFYFVRILAVADPTPPEITEEDLEADLDAEIARCIREAEGVSERELLDQVFRRLTIHLCAACYAQWIEDPAR